MKKIFHKLHLWLSIPFGLIISVICLSGAALVFEDEIMEFCYPERYFVEQVKEKPLPINELLEKVAATLPDSVSVASVSIPSDPSKAYQVGLSKPRRASVYVDQYTGEVKPRFQRTAFFSVMFRTHRWLLDSMKPDGGIFWGKMIVGTSTLIFVFILITGIVIWVPKTIKGLKNRLKVSVTRGHKRFWYDLHLAGGIYAAIILLELALTGLTWSFSWYRTGFYKVFGVEVQQGGGHGGGGQQQSPSADENSDRRPGRDEKKDSIRIDSIMPERQDRDRKHDRNMAMNTDNKPVEKPDSLKNERKRDGGRNGQGQRNREERRGERPDSLRYERRGENPERRGRFAENDTISGGMPDSLRQERHNRGGGRGHDLATNEKRPMPKPDSERQERRGNRGDRNNTTVVVNDSREERPDSLRHEGQSERGERGERGGNRQSAPVDFVVWQQVYDQLSVQNPTNKQISVSKNSANISFDTWGNQRGSDRYIFDPKTGEITDTKLYKDQDNSGKIRGWIYSVHVGSWGGMLTRILTFIAAFLGGTLPLTGYYIWIRKSFKKKKKKA